VHRGSPGDHAKRADLGQIGDKRLRHAVGEVVLLGVAGKIGQRQHGQRFDARHCSVAELACAPTTDGADQDDDQRENSDGSVTRWLGGSPPDCSFTRRQGEYRLRTWRSDRYRGLDGGWQLGGAHEAVAASRDRFDVARPLSRIAQQVADFLDCHVQAIVKIHERIGRPQHLLQFVPRNDLAPTLQQHTEYLERLVLLADSQAVLPDLT